jgi:hypothetical protein
MKHPHAIFQNTTVQTQGSIPWTGEATPTSIICGDEIFPVQKLEGELIFPTPLAAQGSVAAADYTDASPTTKYRLKGSGRKIENDQWSVRFDVNGNISSIQSIEDGTEFIEILYTMLFLKIIYRKKF